MSSSELWRPAARDWYPARAVLLLTVLCVGPTADAVPSVVDDPTTITVSNENLSFSIGKTGSAAGEMRSLVHFGVDLMGGGSSRGYFSAFRGPIGSGSSYWELGQGETQVSYSAESDFVDVAIYHPADASMPYDVTQHYILRDGEHGFHTYATLHHADSDADYYVEELRYLLRADPEKYTHHWITPDRREVMPAPGELGSSVQDATHEVSTSTQFYQETGKEYYTKYDYSVGTDEVGVYGFYSEGTSVRDQGFGMWLVQPNKESLLGGPTKQELTVHQTTSTPALIGMLVGQHYNNRVHVETPGEYSRNYGPYYVHLNRGVDAAAMQADAASYYDIGSHQPFYDSLGLEGWVDTADRGAVSGEFRVDGLPGEGAYVILHDNASINPEADFQFSRYGYQYWARVEPDGSFDLSGVRPGTYRLSAYAPGTYGEYRHGEVTVGQGATLALDPIDWAAPDNGVELWRIGEFDRTATEFRRGANDEFRSYAMWEQYPQDFPNDVSFVIGQSDEATDWNYMHWENIAGHGSPDWDVVFDLVDLPNDETATLTIAVAGQSDSRLRVRVNGTIVLSDWRLPYEGSVGHRSGMVGVYQSREVSFSSALLQTGQNVVTFEHVSPEGASASSPRKEGIVYDAIRLEIGGFDQLAGDFNGDGLVDAADYTVWRDSEGMTGVGLAADSNFDGRVDYRDYAAWADNFGRGASSSSTLVPEPTGAAFATAVLLLVDTRVLTTRRRTATRPTSTESPRTRDS